MSRLGLTCRTCSAVGHLGEPSKISIRWSRPLGELFALRTFIDLAFELPLPSLIWRMCGCGIRLRCHRHDLRPSG